MILKYSKKDNFVFGNHFDKESFEKGVVKSCDDLFEHNNTFSRLPLDPSPQPQPQPDRFVLKSKRIIYLWNITTDYGKTQINKHG